MFSVIFWISCSLSFHINVGLEYEDDNVNRHKRETMIPEIFVNISSEKPETLSSGEILQYKACLEHAGSSTAAASNILLKWVSPSYVAFQNLTQTSAPRDRLRTSFHSSVAEIEVTRLLRNESVCFNFAFIFDPENLLKPGRHFIVSSILLRWGAQALPLERGYVRPWRAFSVEVEVPGCSEELGIISGDVKDYMMTSSSYLAGFEEFKARLGDSSKWCAETLNSNQFLQVDFIHEVIVTKISFHSLDISQLTLEYSVDNRNWKNYSEYGVLKMFYHEPEHDVPTIHWIIFPFKAYNIRMRPKLWKDTMCLTLALYGCHDKMSKAACNRALGMESGFITDAALSAKMPHANTQDSRLNKEAFLDKPAGWLASPYDAYDYLQIDLAVLHSVTKVGVQGEWSDGEPSKHFVRHYMVNTSNDSKAWVQYVKEGNITVFDGPQTSAMGVYPTFTILEPPAVARFVRIYPQEELDAYRIMRLELYGCLQEPMPSNSVPDDFARRSYVLNDDTGIIHVCSYDRTGSSCMFSSDGKSWTKFKPTIVNILAIDPVREMMYALDRSNNYLRSSDNGQTWTAIPLQRWTKAKTTLSLTFAKTVPENLVAKDHVGGDVSVSRDGSQWTVSNVGVHLKRPNQEWRIAATWKCCTA